MSENITPRVFVSAASSDLRSARRVVNEALTRIECLPIEESVFGTEYGPIRHMLRRKIEDCQGVVHLVGRDYGSEPEPATCPSGAPRRSWTQLEYDVAKELNKKLYIIVCDDAFPFDPVAEPEPADKRALQNAHRATVLADERVWHKVHETDELRQEVENLKVPLDELRDELGRVQSRRQLRLGSALAVLFLLVIGAILGIRHLHQRTVGKLTNPEALAASIHKQIEASAKAKIDAVPNKPGRWHKISKIENERDLARDRVDDLIRLIEQGLKEGASDVFQRATQIMEKEGIDAALSYLQSRRPSTLKTARREARQVEAAKEQQRNRALQALLLEANSLDTRLEWGTALELRRQIVQLAPDWLDARSHLGKSLWELAQFRDAEPHLRAALALAATPDEEAVALNDLAGLLLETNRLSEAEPLMRRALAIDERTYGTEHRNVARDLNNLAGLLLETNRLSEAEPLMRRALAIDKQSYGAEHPNVARDLNNVAGLLDGTKRPWEAEPLMRRALAIHEQCFGSEHPHVALNLSNLAALLLQMNRLSEAEPLMRRALAIDEQSYGAEHPSVGRDLNNLAGLLLETDRPSEAESLMRRALAIHEQSYGAEDPNVARDLNNLTGLLQATNRLSEAEPLMRRMAVILHRLPQATGHQHPNMQAQLKNYRLLLAAMEFPPDEIDRWLHAAMETAGPLQPITPEVERLLGPAEPVADVLATLDRQYREEGRSEVYFLPLDEPISPHLDELLDPVTERSSGLSTP